LRESNSGQKLGHPGTKVQQRRHSVSRKEDSKRKGERMNVDEVQYRVRVTVRLTTQRGNGARRYGYKLLLSIGQKTKDRGQQQR